MPLGMPDAALTFDNGLATADFDTLLELAGDADRKIELGHFNPLRSGTTISPSSRGWSAVLVVIPPT